MKRLSISEGTTPKWSFTDKVNMGDGIIPLKEFFEGVHKAGHKGFFEVEILSDDLIDADYEALLKNVCGSYKQLLSQYE